MNFNINDISDEQYTDNESVPFDKDKVIKMNRVLKYENHDNFFTTEKFSKGIVFYDFEVFKYDWLVVLINPIEETKQVIVNDREALKKYYHENQDRIWVGYNSSHYDVPILKGIILGMNPKSISDKIIIENKPAWEISPNFNKINLLNFDCFDGVNSLKVLEAFMGDDIEETDVPFDLDRQLNLSEIQTTVKYCIHDVEETIEVFKRRINNYNTVTELIETFDLDQDRINKSTQQITAEVLQCESKEFNDEWDIVYVPTIKLDKYKYVYDWFIESCKKKDYSLKLETDVAGIPHVFGWGGVHGASDKPVHKFGKLFHCDVTSFYPSLMIEYNLLTRTSKDPDKYKLIYDTRVALKKAGKKKEQAPYKTVLNATYGISRQNGGLAYDPRNGNSVCVNGQLLLLDLIEKLEVMGEHFELIQSNTDGIIVWIDDEPKSEKWLKHICNEWIQRTRMGLGFDQLDWIIQKDVNNYVFQFKSEDSTQQKLEVKGRYVKELNDLDNDLPIVNKAIVDYISKKIPVEDTINNCDDMIMFQQVFRISSKFKFGWYGGKELSDRTYRVFASNDLRDSYLARIRDKGENPNKFGNCPDHCFIYNKEVKDKKASSFSKLDKKWYINLAKKRLTDYGYEFKSKNVLF